MTAKGPKKKKAVSNCVKAFNPVCDTFLSQISSICKAAIHAGVVGADGGLVDVLALDKRKSYVGVLKNGIQSERYSSFSAVSYLTQLSVAIKG